MRTSVYGPYRPALWCAGQPAKRSGRRNCNGSLCNVEGVAKVTWQKGHNVGRAVRVLWRGWRVPRGGLKSVVYSGVAPETWYGKF